MSERENGKAIERLAEVLYLTRGADPSIHPWSGEPECDRDKYRVVARQVLRDLLGDLGAADAKQWRTAAQTAIDTLDPMKPSASPATLVAVVRGAKDANATLRARVANRDAEIERLRVDPKPPPVDAVLCPACRTEMHFEGTVLCCSGCGRSRRMRHG